LNICQQTEEKERSTDEKSRVSHPVVSERRQRVEAERKEESETDRHRERETKERGRGRANRRVGENTCESNSLSKTIPNNIKPCDEKNADRHGGPLGHTERIDHRTVEIMDDKE
jgi:hypothetical protein